MDMFETELPMGGEGHEHHIAARGGSSRSRYEQRRVSLHRSALVTVEDSYVPPTGPYPLGFETRHQLGLTYFGAFSYRVGSRKWIIDANSGLFVSPGWQSSEEHLLPGVGHAAVILTPSPEFLDEILLGVPAGRAASFVEASVPASMRLRLLVQQILRSGEAGSDPLQKDEWTIDAFREATWANSAGERRRSSRVVDRAKEYLHAHFGERLFLDEIATAVGVTPVYLTQEFTRQEAVPLYRYQLRLRLSQALLDLPDCEDITGLALDLGFSSHSHFTASFRGAFGLTPSEYRSKFQRPGFRRPYGSARRAA
jgi:AraC-like DNA-binding protein